MLYLFNSASRFGYTVNVLNTLSLPRGYVNEYRYKYSEGTKYLSPELLSSLDSLVNSKSAVLITFIDRFGEAGYEYHPLRMGRLTSWKNEGDQVFLRVRLTDFVWSKNTANATERFVDALGAKHLPVLTNGNAMEPHDGLYAIEHENFVSDLIESGDQAWSKTVDRISTAKAFATDNGRVPLFTRLRLERASSDKELKPSMKHVSSVYKLKRGASYRLVLTYRFPLQLNDKAAHGEVQVGTDDNLSPSSTPVRIEIHANSVDIPIHASSQSDETSGSMRIEATATDGQPDLLTTSAALQYAVVQGGGFWTQLVIAALLYALVSSLQAADLSVLKSVCAWQIAWLLGPKFFLGTLQFGIVYWVFRLLGTKIT